MFIEDAVVGLFVVLWVLASPTPRSRPRLRFFAGSAPLQWRVTRAADDARLESGDSPPAP